MKNYLAEFSANTTPEELTELTKAPSVSFVSSAKVVHPEISGTEQAVENSLPEEVPKLTKPSPLDQVVGWAEEHGWEWEVIDTKPQVPPLPKEIRRELVERGFPLPRVERMRHGEASFWLFRDFNSRWQKWTRAAYKTQRSKAL